MKPENILLRLDQKQLQEIDDLLVNEISIRRKIISRTEFIRELIAIGLESVRNLQVEEQCQEKK